MTEEAIRERKIKTSSSEKKKFLSMKGTKFFHQMSNFELIKKNTEEYLYTFAFH